MIDRIGLHSSRFKWPEMMRVPRGASVPLLLLSAMIVAFIVDFSWLSIQRHNAFQSHAFDLANMDQAVWNTLHGHPLRFTDMQQGQVVLTNRFAIHVEPLLTLFAPFYLIHSGPETLLVLQAAVVGTGALPAYLLAVRFLGRPWVALAFPGAYLLHPSLQNAVLDDFHAVVLTAALLLWMLYFIAKESMLGFGMSAALAVMSKEEVGLVVAATAVVLVVQRHRFAAAIAAGGGVAWFVVCVDHIIPSFNPRGHSPYLGRYGYLGHGLGGIAAGAIHHPGRVVSVLTSHGRLDYLNALLHPMGYVPVLGAPILLLTLPVLLINMLSADSRMYSGFYQYSAEIVPFLVSAAVWGTHALSERARQAVIAGYKLVPAVLCLFVLLAACVDTRAHGFSQLAAGYLVPKQSAHQMIENTILRTVPPNAPVAAADEILPHLSDRYWAYLLPTVHPRNGPMASYIVLDASVPSRPVTPRTLHAVAMHAIHHGFYVLTAQDGVIVLRRSGKRRAIPSAFYSFIFDRSSGARRVSVQWDHLRLIAVKVFPLDGFVTASRPDIHVESYWRCNQPVSRAATITFYVSPVYTGPRPTFSRAWSADSDSPTWDWLPLQDWPCSRTVRAASLPLFPPLEQSGKVDIAVGVSGAGNPREGSATRIADAPSLVRIATVQVRP